MKLLTRTSYLLITAVVFIFFVGGFGFYLILKSESEKEIKEELQAQLMTICHELKEKQEKFEVISLQGVISIEPVPPATELSEVYEDTMLVDAQLGIYKQYKVLISTREIDGHSYRIHIYRSLTESNALIEKIILVVIAILLIFVALFYVLNQFIFERAWKDFFTAIDKLQNYNINSGTEIQFDPSEISEFDLLNATLNQMTTKIQKDYEEIREFTGNISHEIQTPLTIIKQKAELLLQSDSIDEKQASLIVDIQNTTSRLSKLNRTLILQTKIDNKQFSGTELINIKSVVDQHLDIFLPIIKERNISLEYKVIENPAITADHMLIDIMIVNLIKNAISHNIDKGKLQIVLEKTRLIISNTSSSGDLSGTPIFKRYTGLSGRMENLGLGLSLVKKICDLYSYTVSYSYREGLHIFSVEFK